MRFQFGVWRVELGVLSFGVLALSFRLRVLSFALFILSLESDLFRKIAELALFFRAQSFTALWLWPLLHPKRGHDSGMLLLLLGRRRT